MQPKMQKNENLDYDLGNQSAWPNQPFQMMPTPGYIPDQFSDYFAEDYYNNDQHDSSSGGFHSANSHSSRSTESIPLDEYSPHHRNTEPLLSNFDHNYYNPAHFPMPNFSGLNPPQQHVMVGHTGSSSRSMYSGNFAQGTPVYGLNPSYPKQPQNPKARSGLRMQNMPHIQSVELLHDDEAPENEPRTRAYTYSKPQEELLKASGFLLINDQTSNDRDTTLASGPSSRLTNDCFSDKDLSEIFSVSPHESMTLFPPITRPKTSHEMETVLDGYKQEIYEGFKVIAEKKPTNPAGGQGKDSASNKKETGPKIAQAATQMFGLFKKKGT